MRELEKRLDYSFRDPALLEEALNHSSYANEHRSAGIRSNERLEFLGDSVLGFVTAEFLFCQHPDAPEGDLTRIRAALVCEQSLYEVARRLDLGAYLKLGRGEEAGGGGGLLHGQLVLLPRPLPREREGDHLRQLRRSREFDRFAPRAVGRAYLYEFYAG